MNKINKIIEFIKKNIRYFIAAGVLISMFFISRSFPAQVITSESCKSGNCQAILDNPNLSKEKTSYYANDVFKSEPGQYWRLTFKERTNRNSKIKVSITNPSDEDKEIRTLELKKNELDMPQEIVFSTDNNYSDLLFEKVDTEDGAEISINNVRVTKLNIGNEKELANLRPTIIGQISSDSIDQQQKDNSYTFTQLKEPGAIFGQIFKPQADYIASVTLDMDIVKQDNNGGKKYKFELREAEYDGSVPEVTSNVLASVDFTAENIERFRQDDGKFKFPIFAKLDPSKHYFIGINNNNVAVDKFNYLRLKGTLSAGNYADGTVAIKTKGKTYAAVGNLYFITHQLNFSTYENKKILGGEIIEDIGKGQGKFTYQTSEDLYDLADLESYTPDVNYDDGKKVLFGEMKSDENSEMVYKFDTIHPMKKVRTSGVQTNTGWAKAAIYYSYDNANWIEVPALTDNSNLSTIERFDYSWDSISEDELYVRIAPKMFEDGEKYGIKDFRVEADLLIK